MLEFVKEYLRIDFDDDDTTLNILITMSKTYILNATGYAIDEAKELDKIALALTVKHFYDNRDAYSEVELNEVPMSLRSIYFQLQSSVVVE